MSITQNSIVNHQFQKKENNYPLIAIGSTTLIGTTASILGYTRKVDISKLSEKNLTISQDHIASKISIDSLKDVFIKSAKEDIEFGIQIAKDQKRGDLPVIPSSEELYKELVSIKINLLKQLGFNNSKEYLDSLKENLGIKEQEGLSITAEQKGFLKSYEYAVSKSPISKGNDVNNKKLEFNHLCQTWKREKKEIEKIIADKYEIFKKDLSEKINKKINNQKLKVATIYGVIAVAIAATLSYLLRPKLNEK